MRGLSGIVHRPRSLPSADVTAVDAIPVTTPARTLLDMAAVVSADLVEEALDDALRRKLVSLPRLRWRLTEIGRSGRPGVAVLRSLVDARGHATPVPQSVFETRLLRALKSAGLPEPVIQHEVRDRGRLVGVVDLAFPAARVAIEAEGYRWHAGRLRFERDLARRNSLTALGWRVIHVTWADLNDRTETAVQAIVRAVDGDGGAAGSDDERGGSQRMRLAEPRRRRARSGGRSGGASARSASGRTAP
jgi:very-short-patch-repair endonuclease